MDPNIAPVAVADVESPGPTPNPAEAAAVIPTAKVFLAFAYLAKDGNGAPVQRIGRTFMAGVPDVYTQAHVEQVEGMIARDLGFEAPVLMNWERLIA